MTDSKYRRDQELAALRERKLTTLFNRHFSEAAAAIAAERKAAEVALREIERRRAEAALKLASSPKKDGDVGQTLTKLDEMYLELKRREENVRKRERDTLEKYHKYMNSGESSMPIMNNVPSSGTAPIFKNASSGNANAGSRSSGYYNESAAIQKGYVGKNVKKFSSYSKAPKISSQISSNRNSFSSGNVKSAADKLNNPSVSFNDEKNMRYSKKPANGGIRITEPINESDSDLENPALDTKSGSKEPSMTDEEALFQNAQKAAALAEQDGKLEESNLQAQVAERNAYEMAKSMSSWGQEDDSDNLTVTSYGNSSFAESITTANSQASSLVFISEAEMRLTAFLKANTEAIASLSNHVQSTADEYSETQSMYSGSARKEYDEAVLAAEKAAKDMAEAVAWTSNASVISETSTVKKKKKEKWFQYWSEEHGREYYYQPSSGKVVWDPPSQFEDSGTTVKKSDIEQNNVTEEEKVQYDVRNWSMDDFLPERKKRSKSRRKKSGGDASSRGSWGSKSSKNSRGSRSSKGSRRRNSVHSNVSLPKAILSSPKKDYSIWNSKNRKQRKKIVRRSVWGLVLTGVAYKAGTHTYSFFTTNNDAVLKTQSIQSLNEQEKGRLLDEEKKEKRIHMKKKNLKKKKTNTDVDKIEVDVPKVIVIETELKAEEKMDPVNANLKKENRVEDEADKSNKVVSTNQPMDVKAETKSEFSESEKKVEQTSILDQLGTSDEVHTEKDQEIQKGEPETPKSNIVVESVTSDAKYVDNELKVANVEGAARVVISEINLRNENSQDIFQETKPNDSVEVPQPPLSKGELPIKSTSKTNSLRTAGQESNIDDIHVGRDEVEDINIDPINSHAVDEAMQSAHKKNVNINEVSIDNTNERKKLKNTQNDLDLEKVLDAESNEEIETNSIDTSKSISFNEAHVNEGKKMDSTILPKPELVKDRNYVNETDTLVSKDSGVKPESIVEYKQEKEPKLLSSPQASYEIEVLTSASSEEVALNPIPDLNTNDSQNPKVDADNGSDIGFVLGTDIEIAETITKANGISTYSAKKIHFGQLADKNASQYTHSDDNVEIGPEPSGKNNQLDTLSDGENDERRFEPNPNQANNFDTIIDVEVDAAIDRLLSMKVEMESKSASFDETLQNTSRDLMKTTLPINDEVKVNPDIQAFASTVNEKQKIGFDTAYENLNEAQLFEEKSKLPEEQLGNLTPGENHVSKGADQNSLNEPQARNHNDHLFTMNIERNQAVYEPETNMANQGGPFEEQVLNHDQKALIKENASSSLLINNVEDVAAKKQNHSQYFLAKSLVSLGAIDEGTEKKEEAISASNGVHTHKNVYPLTHKEKRPIHCNIPLMYLLTPVCWKLAKQNPLYDVEGLTDFMMQ